MYGSQVKIEAQDHFVAYSQRKPTDHIQTSGNCVHVMKIFIPAPDLSLRCGFLHGNLHQNYVVNIIPLGAAVMPELRAHGGFCWDGCIAPYWG